MVIFDEAHELEEVASSYFGIGLSTQRFDELVRDVDLMLKAKQASTTAIESACAMLRDRSRMFFAALPDEGFGPGRMPFEDREGFLEESGDTYTGAINALTRLEGELELLRNVDEATGLRKRAAEIRAHLAFLLESPDRNNRLLDRAPGRRWRTLTGARRRAVRLPYASSSHADRRLGATPRLALRLL